MRYMPVVTHMKQPSDIWRRNEAQHHGQRNRHQDEDHQRIGRENRDAPILGIAEAHFLVGEKLMMIERMSLVNRAQAFDIDRTMHDETMHRPFEDIRE